MDGGGRDLRVALEELTLADCWEQVSKLGVKDVHELGLLDEQDLVAASQELNALQMRRLRAGVCVRARACVRVCACVCVCVCVYVCV